MAYLFKARLRWGGGGGGVGLVRGGGPGARWRADGISYRSIKNENQSSALRLKAFEWNLTNSRFRTWGYITCIEGRAEENR